MVYFKVRGFGIGRWVGLMPGISGAEPLGHAARGPVLLLSWDQYKRPLLSFERHAAVHGFLTSVTVGNYTTKERNNKVLCVFVQSARNEHNNSSVEGRGRGGGVHPVRLCARFFSRILTKFGIAARKVVGRQFWPVSPTRGAETTHRAKDRIVTLNIDLTERRHFFWAFLCVACAQSIRCPQTSTSKIMSSCAVIIRCTKARRYTMCQGTN